MIARKQGDWLEILSRVVLKRIDGTVENVRHRIAETDCVTVRLRTGDPPNSDATAGTADIFHNDRLTKRGAHVLGQDTRYHISGPAGWVRYDHRDGPRRIGLRP